MCSSPFLSDLWAWASAEDRAGEQALLAMVDAAPGEFATCLTTNIVYIYIYMEGAAVEF